MGIRGTYHKTRVDELVDRFKEWRTARVSGVRAFQSTYDRLVLKSNLKYLARNLAPFS
jgi:proteasome activator subunit 4